MKIYSIVHITLIISSLISLSHCQPSDPNSRSLDCMASNPITTERRESCGQIVITSYGTRIIKCGHPEKPYCYHDPNSTRIKNPDSDCYEEKDSSKTLVENGNYDDIEVNCRPAQIIEKQKSNESETTTNTEVQSSNDSDKSANDEKTKQEEQENHKTQELMGLNKGETYYQGKFESKQKEVEIAFVLTRKKFHLQFQGKHNIIGDKFIIQFRYNPTIGYNFDHRDKPKTNSILDCPSLAYWFRKDIPDQVSFTLAAACREGEKAPLPVYRLAGDWNRQADNLIVKTDNISKIWNFVGQREFEQDGLTDFGFDEYEYIRLYAFTHERPNSPLDETFELKRNKF